eukprot:COSAG01_NODE_46284_length_401_cov_1.341060_1_plen_58_part_10
MKIDGSRIVDIRRRLLVFSRCTSKIPIITVRDNIRGIFDPSLFVKFSTLSLHAVPFKS